MWTIIHRPYVHSPSSMFNLGTSSRTAIIEPMALAMTSHNKPCHAAPTTTRCAWPVVADSWLLGSRILLFVDLAIPHFQQAIAALRESPIMRGHQQSHSLRRHHLKQ